METSKVKFRCGADPEVFLMDSTGKHISSIGLVKADKWNPLQIPDMPKGFTLQEDNVSLEYGIPPAKNAKEFIRSINRVMEASRAWTKGLDFSTLSCTIFDEDQMEHPAAHVFGCEPDFNAWDGKENKKPNPPHPFMRSAGGHIHVETKQDGFAVARQMDLYLGVPSVLMDNGEERKKLYGTAGACRIKPYGVEYRTLSNFWIFKDRLIQWVWDNTERALNSTVDVRDYTDEILTAINSNDKSMAAALVSKFNLEVV